MEYSTRLLLFTVCWAHSTSGTYWQINVSLGGSFSLLTGSVIRPRNISVLRYANRAGRKQRTVVCYRASMHHRSVRHCLPIEHWQWQLINNFSSAWLCLVYSAEQYLSPSKTGATQRGPCCVLTLHTLPNLLIYSLNQRRTIEPVHCRTDVLRGKTKQII